MTITDSPARSSPLEAVHAGLGATFTDFAGWRMPLRYGSESAEHRAVRTAAGIFDLSHMGEITVAGPDAAAALDYALVGWFSPLEVGRARYTMIVDDDGGVLDDLVVYRTGETQFLVVANAANTALVASALGERLAGFTARCADQSADYALVAVQGPAAAALLATLTQDDLAGLRYYACTPATVAGVPVLAARTGYTGEDGFEMFAGWAVAERLWAAVHAAGAGHGLLPAGLACRDTLRLEAGMALYGHELSRQRDPFAAGLGRVVAFDKPGDFVGRSALQGRRDAGARQRLVGLVARGRRVPRAGQRVLDGTPGGGVVGEVTSGSPSPTLGRPIAMAYVSTGPAAEPGAELAVDVRGRHEPVEVVRLPFYRRPRPGAAAGSPS